MTLRKKTTLTVSMILCVLLALTLVPPLYAADYTITAPGGGDCSIAGGTWNENKKTCTLTADLTGDNIVIDGNDITLDCDQHSISGAGTGAGISVSEDSGVTIKNCIIREYGVGITLNSCSESTVIRNTVVDNSGSGISLGVSAGPCQYNTVKRNTTVDNNYGGINIGDCQYITLTGNTSYWNRSGIVFNFVSDSTVEGNNANANNEAGIEIFSSIRNTLTSNTTNLNGYYGINISDSSYFTLTGNISKWNVLEGIYLIKVNDTNLTGNKSNSNGGSGIALVQCLRNTVEGNTAKKNGYVHVNGGYGCIDEYYTGGGQTLPNTWVDNECKRNHNGGSIHGDASTSIGGELCAPQF